MVEKERCDVYGRRVVEGKQRRWCRTQRSWHLRHAEDGTVLAPEKGICLSEGGEVDAGRPGIESRKHGSVQYLERSLEKRERSARGLPLRACGPRVDARQLTWAM